MKLHTKVLRNPTSNEIRKRKVPGGANVAMVHDKAGMLLRLELKSISTHDCHRPISCDQEILVVFWLYVFRPY
jgi:hypothetical protein